MSINRLGVFGGTFDPPHIGHLILAAEACADLNFDHLLWVITPVPPHKLDQPITPLEHRLTMLELAILNDSNFELSRIEIDRPGPHYMVDTMRLLAEQNPSADLILLIGGDSLRDLPTWHRPGDLVAACHQIGVIRRPGDSVDLSVLESSIPGIQTKVRFVEAPQLEISSSDIRRRIRAGLPYRYFLSRSVYDYILDHDDLYT